MYNNLIFLSNPVNGAQLLMQLTLWTFSVNSIRGGFNAGIPLQGPNHLSPPYLKEDLKPLPKPLAILARGLQPLLLVALSLRYAWASEPWRAFLLRLRVAGRICQVPVP